MRQRLLILELIFLLAHLSYGQTREVHILAANDMHAAIDAFPQFAAIADSLRTLYPSLLVFSAGDNRTGNAFSDMYEISSYPIVALMNQVGFNASALGNHEFDVKSLPPLMGLSNFSYICANASPSEKSGLHIVPTQVFDVDGLKIGVIGVIQINTLGRPDTHPDNVEDIKFSLPMNAVAKYESFSHQCDATILLSHVGYEGDIKMAQAFPWLDLIIGGHTHHQLTTADGRMLIMNPGSIGFGGQFGVIEIDEATGRIKVYMGEINDLGGICLSLFLGIAMITLKIWQLAALALPLVILLLVQLAFMYLFARFVIFRFMGRDYDAAVITAGTCGFGMGATPNAMANMQAICDKYVPSIKAYLMIPIVGSLFADFINSLVITFFINLV